MSRFSDNYDEDFNNQGELWWANCERAVAGKRGQRDLRDLLAYLEAMPQKRLIEGYLVKEGEVCTVGAFVVARRMKKGEAQHEVLNEIERRYATCQCGHALSKHDAPSKQVTLEGGEAPMAGPCQTCRAWYDPSRSWSKLCSAFTYPDYEDDLYSDAHETASEGRAVGMTYSLAWRLAYLNDEEFEGLSPEQRYVKVVAWLRENIKEPAAA